MFLSDSLLLFYWVNGVSQQFATCRKVTNFAPNLDDRGLDGFQLQGLLDRSHPLCPLTTWPGTQSNSAPRIQLWCWQCAPYKYLYYYYYFFVPTSTYYYYYWLIGTSSALATSYSSASFPILLLSLHKAVKFCCDPHTNMTQMSE